jgi:hypothetical protein
VHDSSPEGYRLPKEKRPIIALFWFKSKKLTSPKSSKENKSYEMNPRSG